MHSPDPPWRRCRQQPLSRKPHDTDHLRCSRGQAEQPAGALEVLTAAQVGPRGSAFALCCDRSGRAQGLGGHQWGQGEEAHVGLGLFARERPKRGECRMEHVEG